jgi:hypothetical protein
MTEYQGRPEHIGWPDWSATDSGYRRVVIDPIGCGCTDCIMGESIPADLVADRTDILAVGLGHMINRSSMSDDNLYGYLTKP